MTREHRPVDDGTNCALAAVMPSTLSRLSLVALIFALAGCQNAVETPNRFGEAPVSELGPLMEGVPPQDALPDESKADEVYPRRFDLLDTQTPVRDQGERGTCTAFTAVALMESIYISDGLLENPDFSEQFLYWSVKAEHDFLPMTSGSSIQQTMESIGDHGIVSESLWPYELTAWGTDRDPRCTGTTRPMECWTNGEPPAAARMAERSFLSTERYIRSTRRSIQGHMVERRTPVAIGGPMFYQAWSMRRSGLPTSFERWLAGIVLLPNHEDIADSARDPSGHAVLIVGWDEDMEVQQVDGDNEPVFDANGQPVMERGFFLFKNSWGGTDFGLENTAREGYGWISMRYVEQHMWAYISSSPGRELPETCNNRIDDDRDGQLDCEDTDCVADTACTDGVTVEHATRMHAIPDGRRAGVFDEVYLNDDGVVSSLAVTVDITHPHRGDLRIAMLHEDRTVTLLDRVGGADDDVRQTFSVADFNGMPAAGAWRLIVVDTRRGDAGTLNSWSVSVTRCVSGNCAGSAQTRNYAAAPAASIPDDDTAGISDDIVITDAGTISQMRAHVAVTHSFPMDLTIRLSRVGGREFVLLREAVIDGPSFERTFVVDGFVGEPVAGTFRLTVVDTAAQDVGTLDRWSLDMTTR